MAKKEKQKYTKQKDEDMDKMDAFTSRILQAPAQAVEKIKNDRMMMAVGIVLVMFACYLLFIFGSYLITGAADQSILHNPTAQALANENQEIINQGGTIGAQLSNFLINDCFGLAAFCIPVFIGMLGLRLTNAYKFAIIKWFACLSILMYWLSITLAFISDFTGIMQHSFLRIGGNHGLYVYHWLTSQIGTPGVLFALMTVAILYFIYLSSEAVFLLRNILNPAGIKKVHFEIKRPKEHESQEHTEAEVKPEQPQESASEEQTDLLEGRIVDDPNAEPIEEPEEEDHSTVLTLDTTPSSDDEEEEELDPNDAYKPVGMRKGSTKPLITDPDYNDFVVEAAQEEEQVTRINQQPYDPRLDLENYKFPTLDLLKDFGNQKLDIDMAEQNANKDRIIKVLRSFGVEISSIQATVGPTITLYEITPAEGVRISKIRNLEDDIALSLAALGIRIIAPIPGKGTIGIEVPNRKSQIVPMREIVSSRKFQESDFELPVAFGKTITNEVHMIDLAKAPHMLVAGATGMGKSVGLNAVVTSLLYKKHPAELKFVIIDPKKVEFAIYAPIEKHYLAKLPDNDDAIITDVDKVVNTLKSLCQEMDDRYDLLKHAGVRNLKEYNAKFIARKLNPTLEVPMTHKRDYPVYHHFLPYIVTIIDEFGDLIMTAGKEVETPICRLAQLARAIGIHCIIATQRPTASIITGNIKANFPARVAFRVAAMMDSRTILDRSGAQQLIGRGDMLYLQGADPIRVQCAFVDTPEVEDICKYISKQQGYPSAFELHPVYEESEMSDGGGGDLKPQEIDPMFREAATLIVTYQQGSTSLIQRKLAIGYNRAGRLMDQLERAGIVGAANGSKAREVMCISEEDLEMRLQNLGI